MNPEVTEMWAVTISGALYRLSSERDEQQVPLVEKVAATDASQHRAVKVGARLMNGYFVGITEQGLVMYHEQHTRQGQRQTAHDVNSVFKGGHSSEIVGLFLREEDAKLCLASPAITAWDERWENETKKVLTAIGTTHSVFAPDPAVLERFGL